jgi:hypothetical protein
MSTNIRTINQNHNLLDDFFKMCGNRLVVWLVAYFEALSPQVTTTFDTSSAVWVDGQLPKAQYLLLLSPWIDYT